MGKIDRVKAESMVNEWNSYVKNFMENELPVLLEKKGVPVKNGRITLNYWFTAMQIVQDQKHYEKARMVQIILRNAGYDVKMNMQDHTLTIY